MLQEQISLLRKSISRKNLAQHEAHDCCARVGFWKECRFIQQSPLHLEKCDMSLLSDVRGASDTFSNNSEGAVI